METPNYVKSLLEENAVASAPSRRVWSIDLQTVWLPFFTATNVMNDTHIPSEDLGAPLRLAKAKDGSVRFSANGRPQLRVAPTIRESIKTVQQNFIAGLQTYAGMVMEERQDEYAQQVQRAQQAGAPIIARDAEDLAEAERLMAEAQAQQHGESAVPSEPEAVAAHEETPERGRRRQPQEVAA